MRGKFWDFYIDVRDRVTGGDVRDHVTGGECRAGANAVCGAETEFDKMFF